MSGSQRGKGIRVVALGGGTGLSTLLRGLKAYTDEITAIITVADDGGSSGRLRQEFGILPPGDFRNCIAALADDEALIAKLFQYRFGRGDGLDGHSFGNLFLAALVAVTGSFDRALLEASRVLAVRGRVLPATLKSVTLCADVRRERPGAETGWRRVWGESRIPMLAEGESIERVFLQPERPPAYPEAVRAILNADLIVAGPGSLFTSVLPSLLIPDIIEAIRTSQAVKVYVCNVATQRGETTSFGVHEHVQALQAHVGRLFPLVLANGHFPASVPLGDGIEWVRLPDLKVVQAGGYRLAVACLVDADRPWRHASDKLARSLLELYRRETIGSDGGLVVDLSCGRG
ncbi:MAG: YvcK family protein [Anaerolineae bacterium]|nr:YvcK family protein [Anaerolineae bacterium]